MDKTAHESHSNVLMGKLGQRPVALPNGSIFKCVGRHIPHSSSGHRHFAPVTPLFLDPFIECACSMYSVEVG